MLLTWNKPDAAITYKDASVAFRLNAMDDLITDADSGPADDIWWLAAIELIWDESLLPDPIGTLISRAEAEGLEPPLVHSEFRVAGLPPSDLKLITVLAKRDYLNAANTLGSERDLFISRVVLSGIAPPEMIIGFKNLEPPDTGDFVEVDDDAVIVAVIDNGMAIGHNLFRSPDDDGVLSQSRVRDFWNMDAEEPDTQYWTGTQIDHLLAGNIHNDLLDEDTFYRELGLIDWSRQGAIPTAHRGSHGTHVMGLAAGFPTQDAVANAAEGKRPIIAVQLPTRLVGNPAGYELVPPTRLALQYVKNRAARFMLKSSGKTPPLVVNFSFGNFSGPHDGTGPMELLIQTAMDSTATHPRGTVLPAGNGNLARCHAQIPLSNSNLSETLSWRVLPDDRSWSHVHFWLPKLDPLPEDLLSLAVQPPANVGPQSVTTIDGQEANLETEDGTIIGTVKFVGPHPPTDRGRFEVSIRPTVYLDANRHLSPSGLWQLTLTKKDTGISIPEIAAFTVQSWINRDETLPGFPDFGRQSYFDQPDYSRTFEPGKTLPAEEGKTLIGKELEHDPADVGLVQRAGSLNGFACGTLPAVIAGMERSTSQIAPYSASGPTENQHRLDGPDGAAVSDDSPVFWGVMSAGSNSGAMLSMQGTSVAAPQVARWVTGPMAVGGDDARDLVRDKAAHDEPHFPPPSPLDIRTGEGRMDLPNLFGKLRNPPPEEPSP